MKSSSERMVIPRLDAFFNFAGPIFSPATTKSVLEEIDETFFPPFDMLCWPI